MQFEIGKIYDTGAKDDELELCTDTVFHYCDSIQKVHEHYRVDEDNRFCEIEVLGREISDGEKCGSNKIRIVREITGDELNIMLGKINGNTGIFNTGNYNTGIFNTGNYNTGDWNTGNYNTGDWNTGNYNTGDWNTGYSNTGIFNSCNYSTGAFCNKDEKIRIFNIQSEMTMKEFLGSKYYRALYSAPFTLTGWVYYLENEKDTEDKKALRGYLRRYTYKEACANWWENMTEKNKKIIMSMPNFDKEVFYDITGIEV